MQVSLKAVEAEKSDRPTLVNECVVEYIKQADLCVKGDQNISTDTFKSPLPKNKARVFKVKLSYLHTIKLSGRNFDRILMLSRVKCQDRSNQYLD